jgi:DNA ligase-1
VYGAFLLAVYDGEGEEYQTISKIGTGFSEELESLKIPGPKPYYRRASSMRRECRGDQSM